MKFTQETLSDAIRYGLRDSVSSEADRICESIRWLRDDEMEALVSHINEVIKNG